jgi:hypothetical protein
MDNLDLGWMCPSCILQNDVTKRRKHKYQLMIIKLYSVMMMNHMIHLVPDFKIWTIILGTADERWNCFMLFSTVFSIHHPPSSFYFTFHSHVQIYFIVNSSQQF